MLIAHSNHLKRPFALGSELTPKYRDVFDNNKYCDAFVILTFEQKLDIEIQFDFTNCHVIPNPIYINNSVESSERDKHLAVVVSRLHKIKRIDKIILNFKRVVEIVPTAKFEIWGTGEEEENLKKFTVEHDLTDAVLFKGFSVNPASVFRRACVSLGMSLSEGFGVSFAESLACGTPVVSIATKYGPADIITNDCDGFIVTDENDFIEKTSYLLSNPAVCEIMGHQGIINSKRFSIDIIIEEWLNLFKSISSNKKQYSVETIEHSHGSKDGCLINKRTNEQGWIYVDITQKQANFLEKSGSVFLISLFANDDLSSGLYDIETICYDSSINLFKLQIAVNGIPYTNRITEASLLLLIGRAMIDNTQNINDNGTQLNSIFELLDKSLSPDFQKNILTHSSQINKSLRTIKIMLLKNMIYKNDIFSFYYNEKFIKIYVRRAPYDYIENIILETGSFYEEPALRKIKQFIGQDASVIDVGANIGNHSIFFSIVCECKQIICFEPQKNIYQQLQENILLNNITNCTCYNFLLGEQDGTADIKSLVVNNTGATSFTPQSEGEYRITTLDGYKFDNIKLIKIDVEGMQLSVLKGAKQTLKKFSPLLWIDLLTKGELNETISFLEELDYFLLQELTPRNYLFASRRHENLRQQL